jgi:Domain of unknown function (DUF6460)
MAQDYVQRFFGGPPLAVIGRLILLSILVGVILAAIGFDPWNIVDSVRRLIWHLWIMGFDAVRWLWQYFLLGAVIVLPIWLWCGSPGRRAEASAGDRLRLPAPTPSLRKASAQSSFGPPEGCGASLSPASD